MTRSPSTEVNVQPSLADLMVRFLATRSDAAAAAVEPASGEVEPHEVAAGFRVDPRAAWIDAVAVLQTAPVPVPSEWASLVHQPAAAFAVAMAAGNFPQRVKDLHPLLTKFEAKELRPSANSPAPAVSPKLRAWIDRESEAGAAPAMLLAAGVARAAGDFDRADELLAKAEPKCTGLLRAAFENEKAALQWHRGHCEEAIAAWTAMADSPAVHFNRGMALLFLGKSAAARSALTAASSALPETSGWHALARLYLAVAEIQG